MKSSDDVVAAIVEYGSDSLGLLQQCGGYYECPKNSANVRRGPLVAYRGECEDGKRYVGDIYVNFSKAEQYPSIVWHFACRLFYKLARRSELSNIDVFCGAPEGGKSLADKLAMIAGKRYIYPEKKDSGLKWGRHLIRRGERVVIVEDVSNNFSTTEKMVRLVLDAGGVPCLIVSFLNRSLTVDDVWFKEGFPELPVLSLVRKKIHEYRQDDLSVIADVEAGNVVWDVKNEWTRLEQAMNDVSV